MSLLNDKKKALSAECRDPPLLFHLAGANWKVIYRLCVVKLRVRTHIVCVRERDSSGIWGHGDSRGWETSLNGGRWWQGSTLLWWQPFQLYIRKLLVFKVQEDFKHLLWAMFKSYIYIFIIVIINVIFKPALMYFITEQSNDLVYSSKYYLYLFKYSSCQSSGYKEIQLYWRIGNIFNAVFGLFRYSVFISCLLRVLLHVWQMVCCLSFLISSIILVPHNHKDRRDSIQILFPRSIYSWITFFRTCRFPWI